MIKDVNLGCCVLVSLQCTVSTEGFLVSLVQQISLQHVAEFERKGFVIECLLLVR